MKKTILFLILILFHIYNVIGQVVSSFEAKNAATKKLVNLGINVSTKNIDTIYTFKKNDNILLFEVVYRTGEYVLVSGHKMCKPIIGYSIHNTDSIHYPILNNITNIPMGLKDLILEYVEQINACYSLKTYFPPHSEWYNVDQDSISFQNRLIQVGPLTLSKWGQGKSNDGLDYNAYNYYVENICSSIFKCYAGCGPVSVAQIMYFWKYPVIDYISSEQFDWCNMPNVLDTNYSNYETKRNAVAKLIKKCGIYSNATYCSNDCETTTTLDDDRNVFLRYGYFCSDVKNREDYRDSDWIELIKNNLNNGMPIHYRGKSNHGGHAFVCDGYDNNDMFHFNWGWIGVGNNLWLTLNNLSPNLNYSSEQKAIFNIKPSDEQYICDFTIPLGVFYYAYYSYPGNTQMPYIITPKTMTTLKSVRDTSIYPSSWRTIPTGATAEYVAHKEVILQPGFTAEYGSNFTARIEPCEACEERMVQVDMLTGDDDWQGIDTTQMEMRMYKKGDTAILFQPSVLTLFPNPTSNTLTVQAPNPTEDIQVFDIAGHRVYRWYIESRTDSSTTLNIADIPTGNYILRVQTKDGKSHIGRFAKK